MATTLTTIVTQVRGHLNEATAAYWADADLVTICNRGIRDLWRRINDLFQEYFVTIDDTNVTASASTALLQGVPADVFRVVAIEPRVVGPDNPNKGLIFKNRDYNHPDFVTARAQGPVTPENRVIFYTLLNAGAPVAAPSILIAPTLDAAVNLRLVYNQTLGNEIAAGGTNPIPGESDNALIAWVVAYARAREREDRAPDPEWLAIYATEKTNLCQQLTPRAIQESECVEGMFEGDSEYNN